MSEQVIRHRGGGRDENGQLIAATSATLTAIGVAPGIVPGVTPRQRISEARDGEDVAAIVYFAAGTDLVNSDELTVRGERYRILVNDWRMGGLGGLEVMCSRGQG